MLEWSFLCELKDCKFEKSFNRTLGFVGSHCYCAGGNKSTGSALKRNIFGNEHSNRESRCFMKKEAKFMPRPLADSSSSCKTAFFNNAPQSPRQVIGHWPAQKKATSRQTDARSVQSRVKSRQVHGERERDEN